MNFVTLSCFHLSHIREPSMFVRHNLLCIHSLLSTIRLSSMQLFDRGLLGCNDSTWGSCLPFMACTACGLVEVSKRLGSCDARVATIETVFRRKSVLWPGAHEGLIMLVFRCFPTDLSRNGSNVALHFVRIANSLENTLFNYGFHTSSVVAEFNMSTVRWRVLFVFPGCTKIKLSNFGFCTSKNMLHSQTYCN